MARLSAWARWRPELHAGLPLGVDEVMPRTAAVFEDRTHWNATMWSRITVLRSKALFGSAEMFDWLREASEAEVEETYGDGPRHSVALRHGWAQHDPGGTWRGQGGVGQPPISGTGPDWALGVGEAHTVVCEADALGPDLPGRSAHSAARRVPLTASCAPLREMSGMCLGAYSSARRTVVARLGGRARVGCGSAMPEPTARRVQRAMVPAPRGPRWGSPYVIDCYACELDGFMCADGFLVLGGGCVPGGRR